MPAPIDKIATHQTPSYAPIKRPLLQRGATGSVVVKLQKLLLHWGIYTSAPDGLFDVGLEVAVKAFQHRVFLKEDGIVGPLTWQALYTGAPVNMPVLKQGSQGKAVKILQSVLLGMGHYHGEINEQFDCQTDAAVRSFQRRYGLVPDGVVGPHTWCALSKMSH